MTSYAATDYTVAMVDDDNNVLFLQMRTGELVAGNDVVTRLWQQFEARPGIDLDAAVAAAASEIEADPGELRTAIDDSLAVLRGAGIIQNTPPRHQPRLQAIVADEDAQSAAREAADARARVPRRVAIAGWAGLIFALLLRRMPFWIQLQVLMAIRRVRPQCATLSDTRQIAAAVKRAVRIVPGRLECLEQSLAAFMGGALLGAPPRWCHGGVLQGISIHAWVQAQGVAIDHEDQYGALPTTMICI